MTDPVNINPSAAAIDWHLRRDTLDDGGWAAFVAWLEVPANARAYDRVAAADALLADAARPAAPAPAPTTLHAANDDAPVAPARRLRRIGGWSVGGLGIGGLGIAAALALLVMPARPTPTKWFETRAGESRTIALADGTRIEMNGASRVGVDAGDGGARVAMLDRGEAVFRVAHDAAHPFRVRVGAATVQDVGTVFDVARSPHGLDVAVAEGGVVLQPGAEAVSLAAGQGASLDWNAHLIRRRTVAPELVGGWRGGRLAFADTPLADVAEAVRRRYGIGVALESGLSARPFTGMVAMSGQAARDIPHLAALIGAEWRHQGERWVLAPASGASR